MDEQFEELLEFLGFTDAEQERMADEAFSDFEDFLSTTHEELDSMLSSFMKRQVDPISIPIKRRKLLHDLRNWSGDFDRRGMETATTWPGEEIEDEDDAFAAMKVARERAASRKALKETKEVIDGPGKFNNADYAKWRKALLNQLASMLGAKGVPLSYVVRPKDDADPDDLVGMSFLACTVLQAPVEGETFSADSRTVHQLIVDATTGTEAEDFLLGVASFECGRRDMKVLTEFFEGTGNNDRRKGLAEAALKHLEYRSERAMKYTTFVSKLHGIFQMFRDCGKEKDEDEKVEIFFDKLNHPDLVIQKASSKTLYRRDGNMTFVDVSNLFAFDVISLKPASQMKRGIEAINSSSAGSTNQGAAPDSGIHLSDGRVFTGKYATPKFKALSYDDKRKLREVRDSETGPSAKGVRKIAKVNRAKTSAKALNKKLKALQRTVASLKAGQPVTEPKEELAPAAPPSAPVGAGQQMGGRAGRAAAKD